MKTTTTSETTETQAKASAAAVSQRECILAALEAGEEITPADALERWGCMRLSGRIFELRQAGHSIVGRFVVTGSGARVAAYKLRD